MIFIGLVSIAMVVMAIAMIVVALTAAKALKGMNRRQSWSSKGQDFSFDRDGD